MLLQPASHLQTRRRFDPRQISGLGLWLDASDASTITIATGVSAWNDKSGNGRNFSQGTASLQPTRISAGQNGRDVVRANGTSHLMTCGAGLGLLRNVGGATLMAVSKWLRSPGAVAGGEVYMFFPSGAAVGQGRAFLGGGHTLNKDTLGGRRLDSDSFQGAISSADASTSAFKIHGGLIDYTNSNADQYINGAVDGTTTSFQTDGSTSDTDSQTFALFGHAGGAAYTNLELAEAVAFNRVLTTLQRQQVEGYLAHKWGLASSLPSTHPYRFAAP